MNEHDHLHWFTTHGATTWQGQQNAGQWEANNLPQPATQAPHETYAAYLDRLNAGHTAKQNTST